MTRPAPFADPIPLYLQRFLNFRAIRQPAFPVWHGLSSIPYPTANAPTLKLDATVAGSPAKDAKERSMQMKVFANAVALLGALSLMLAIIVAQLDYQHNWSAGIVTQSNAVTMDTQSVPERVAQANS